MRFTFVLSIIVYKVEPFDEKKAYLFNYVVSEYIVSNIALNTFQKLLRDTRK